jgi:two-component system OmpR family response regulator
MKLLLAEDDDLVADSLSRALVGANYQVERAADGLRAEALSTSEIFDLIILDLGLPKMDGLECLKSIRRKMVRTPVLILTARDAPERRIEGLDAGANDYVIKPFHLGELLARIRALLRLPAQNINSVIVGELHWDARSHLLRRGNDVIDLPPKEHAMLEALFQNLGSLVTKQRLALILSEEGVPASFNSVDIVAHRLRKKLEPYGFKLKTIRGLGFLAEA